MRPWRVFGGATALTLGLMLLALGGEGLAVFNSCVANPSRLVSEMTGSLAGFLAVVLAGIVLTVGGVVVVSVGPGVGSKSS